MNRQQKRKQQLWTPQGNVCAYCRKDLASEVRIRNAETKGPTGQPLHLCVECFSVGVEVFGHKASHKYSVIDTVSIYPLSKDWTADEELRLLEAVNKFGYGNWVDVAEHVGGGKTRDRAKRHYEKFFLLNAELDLSQPARPGTGQRQFVQFRFRNPQTHFPRRLRLAGLFHGLFLTGLASAARRRLYSNYCCDDHHKYNLNTR